MQSESLKAGSQYNATQCVVLHYVAFVLMLVETQHDARIDLDSILAFLCVGFLHLMAKKMLNIYFCIS